MFCMIDRCDRFFYTNGIYSRFCELCSQKYTFCSNICWKYAVCAERIKIPIKNLEYIVIWGCMNADWNCSLRFNMVFWNVHTSACKFDYRQNIYRLHIGHHTVVCWLSKIRILKCRRSYESPGCIDKLNTARYVA